MHLADSHLLQFVGRLDVEAGNDVLHALGTLSKRGDDLALTCCAVREILVELGVGLVDHVAVRG